MTVPSGNWRSRHPFTPFQKVFRRWWYRFEKVPFGEGLWPRRGYASGATLIRVQAGARCELIALDVVCRANRCTGLTPFKREPKPCDGDGRSTVAASARSKVRVTLFYMGVLHTAGCQHASLLLR